MHDEIFFMSLGELDLVLDSHQIYSVIKKTITSANDLYYAFITRKAVGVFLLPVKVRG